MEAFVEAALKFASMIRFVDAFVESPVEASVEASIYSMEAFMTFHAKSSSAGDRHTVYRTNCSSVCAVLTIYIVIFFLSGDMYILRKPFSVMIFYPKLAMCSHIIKQVNKESAQLN